MSRLCLHEDNCRGGNEVSVKITCDVEENVMFGKAFMWPCWKEDSTQKKRTKAKRKEKDESGGGVIKVGGAIT